MIITCKACNTSFNLDEKIVKPTGSKVRCSVCANIFTAFPPQAAAAEAPAPADDSADSLSSPVVDHAQPPAGALAATTMVGASADDTDADRSESEADVLAEDADDLFADGTDLDFAIEEEMEEDAAAEEEIEDAVSEVLGGDAEHVDGNRAVDIADDSDATMIASLDDDDLDLSLSPGEEDQGAAATVIADLDHEDFDLDVPVEDDDGDGTTTVIANLDDETFDLDDDFTLETDGAGATQETTDVDGPQTLDEVDNLNLTLDVPPEAEESTAAPTPTDAETAEASLDDLSLDFDLDDDRGLSDVPEEPEPTGTSEADMELSLDGEETETEKTGASLKTPQLEDDLDLSSLEGLLDEDVDKEAPAKIEDDDVTLVIDNLEASELSLDADDGAVPDETDDALEDLEFDLDGDAKAETADIEDADDTDQEIDLSEIEKMLEEPEEGKPKFSSVPDQDLDLDIEASLETEKWMSESIDEEQLVKDEELDLSELEQVLDEVDTDADEEPPEDEELKLDLSEEASSLGSADETVAVDELDFDLTDFEEVAAVKPSREADGREPADMELEFEVEEDRKTEQTFEDESLEATVAVEAAAAAATTAQAAKAPEASAPPPPKTPKPVKPAKKGVSKSLIFILIVVILGGGGYGTYYLLQQYGIEVPFISEYFKPKVNDPGNLKLTTYDITSKFVDNANVGKLFVVTGRVKNGYDENRSMITLAGKIFSAGKVQAQQERVYAGNVMSDLELANLEGEKIKTRLSNRLGDNRSNVKIEPGQSIAFMVVFSNLPEDLEEFTIEVTSSTPLK